MVILIGGAGLLKSAVLGPFGWFFELFFAMCDHLCLFVLKNGCWGPETCEHGSWQVICAVGMTPSTWGLRLCMNTQFGGQ